MTLLLICHYRVATVSSVGGASVLMFKGLGPFCSDPGLESDLRLSLLSIFKLEKVTKKGNFLSADLNLFFLVSSKFRSHFKISKPGRDGAKVGPP